MNADRNLLFGVLALQMEFIDRDALVAAIGAWGLDPSRSLGEILRSQNRINDETLGLVDGLVRKHLELHGGDGAQSLAALTPSPEQQVTLAPLADSDPARAFASWPRSNQPADDVNQPPANTAGAESRFRVLRPHAKGGLGQVSIALDRELHREVALKEIQERYAHDAESRSRFVLEAEITGGLEHPGIVPVYGLGTYADGRPFYAMRFIRGDSLKEAIERFHGRKGRGNRLQGTGGASQEEGERRKEKAEGQESTVDGPAPSSSFILHPFLHSSFASCSRGSSTSATRSSTLTAEASCIAI